MFSEEVAELILSGKTADIYFLRTKEILQKLGINPIAVMEVFPSRAGVLCGIKEVLKLLSKVLPAGSEVWGLEEGERMERKEVVLKIKGPYQSFALYETAYLGMLAHPSGWATAARDVVDAAGGIPVISFGARHVHPAVAGIMEYAAQVGGCAGAATTIGAELMNRNPVGTIPHALILCLGDTVKAAQVFDEFMPPEIPRVILVDTFKDEVEESVRVAQALGRRLYGVRLDTPLERGRVTPELVKEVRAHLDLAGFNWVKIFVSGGITPQRIKEFKEAGAPVDAFGVGSYITSAPPIDFTADIHEVDGKPVAKRGRLPGITPNPRLKKLL